MLFPAVATFFLATAPSRSVSAPAPAPTVAASTIRSGSGTLEQVRGLIRAGRYGEAERAARVLLRERERTNGMESMPVAEVLDQLAEAMRMGGRTGADDAQAICERAVRLKEKLAGKHSVAYAASLHNLGALHMANGEFARSRPLLQEALDIRERILGPDDPEVARSLLFLANVETQSGHDLTAVPLAERAAAIQRKALAEDDPERARGLSMLAGLRYNLGDFITPPLLNEEVLALRRKTLVADHPLVAETLHNMGVLATETGDYEQALRYLREALRIRRLRLGRNHPLVAATLLVMGGALRGTGDLSGARKCCEESLRIQENPLQKDKTLLAWTLREMGELLLQLQEFARAKRLLTRAMVIQERELGPDATELAWTLNSLARVAEHEGRRDEARRLYERSLHIKEAVYGSTYPDVVETLGQLARLLAATGDTARAFSTALRAANAGAEHLRSTARGLSERQALAYAEVGRQPLDVVLALAGSRDPGRVPAAWDALIHSRNVVLDEIAARHGVSLAESGDGSDAGPRRTLDAARSRYANLLVRGVGEDRPQHYRLAIDRARDDVEHAERALAAASSPFKATMRQETVGWKEVSDALPEGWGLVAFALYGSGPERSYIAFVGRSGRVPVAVPIGAASSIEPLVARFVRTVGSGDRTADGRLDRGAEAACRAAGIALRRRIWDPIQTHVGGLDRVFLIPDGALHLVNFTAFPAETGEYLIENGPLIQYLSAERDLVRIPRRHEGAGLLALGGVSFDAAAGTPAVSAPEPSDSTLPGERRGARAHSARGGPQPDCIEFRNTRFAPLPETAREVEEIASAWGDRSETVTLTGARASEAALKKLAPGRRVLHLATHGFFLDAARCGAEGGATTRGIGVTTGPRKAEAGLSSRHWSPLLVSGLALAGANRRLQAKPDQEDGVLMAEEVASLDLSKTEWVVLSACDTGLGKTQAGEGVLGLQRAFQAAGAGAVIMSLWEVDDRTTRAWMRHLYESRFRLGRSTPEAVREADLEVLRDRRAHGLGTHPFYWAGFVATGDWR